MKYWTEQENNPTEKMEFWQGTHITKLADNEIFLYGSNPQGINGAGAAKAAMSLSKGAKHGIGRGLNGSSAYALVTKSLNAGFLEKSTGILYDKEGYCSVSTEQIRENIVEFYEYAKNNKDKKFLVSYQFESWPNGTPKKSLNGYTSQEMLEMFAKDQDIPSNIVFHDSYKPHLEKILKNKQSTGQLVITEDDKAIDIKEDDIVWTIDSDESNPQARHFAGAAKAALAFGAIPINTKQNKPGIARGLSPNQQTYALITKSLEAGYTELETGITYDKEGFQSVSPEQIRHNVDELYETAKKFPEKSFLITYQFEAWPNGTPKKSLNGYTSQEMLEMFAKDKEIPDNIIFHETYKPHLEKLFNKDNKQTNGQLVVSEDGKAVDIKEEDIIWTIDSDESYPEGRHGAGAAKVAKERFGAVYGIGKGLQNQSYALITKSLKAGYTDKDGTTYPLEGERSISPDQIRKNIDQLYTLVQQPEHQDKKFLVTYQFETYPNGAPKKSLNGYTSQEMLEMFVRPNIPANIVFHDSYQPHLEKLLNKENTMTNSPEYTYFFHLTSPFSNFHPSKFEYKGFTFVSNEQFMMFSKAKTFNDEATADRIINIHREFSDDGSTFKTMQDKLCYQLAGAFKRGEITRDQILNDRESMDAWNTIHKKIKQLGRGVQNYNDDVWTRKRTKVVLFGAREKFNQNPELKHVFLSTGNTIMVEASPYDKIWGIGLSAADAKKTDPAKWPGMNLLGNVLDTLKLEFQNNLTPEVSKKKALSNSPIEVLNFYHLNKIIPEDGEYIGRANKNFNLTQSLFANPFPVYKPEERGSSIGKFTDWLWKQIAENNITKDDLLGLAGKKLVCYCKPKACHGDVLKETVELLINNEPEFDRRVEEIRTNKSKPKF